MRGPLRAGLVLLIGLLASGCVSFADTPTITQTGDAGGIRLTVPLCSTDTHGDPCGNPGASNEFKRLYLGVLLPQSLTPPATIGASVAPSVSAYQDGVLATRDRVEAVLRSDLAARFQSASPAPDGLRWTTYVSEAYAFADIEYRATGLLDVEIPREADGRALENVDWRVTAQVTEVPNTTESTDPAAVAICGQPTDCDLSGGIRYPESGTQRTPLRTLVVRPAEPTSIAAGTSKVIVPAIRLDGGALPGAGTVTFAASVDMPGATAQVSTASVVPTSGQLHNVPITVTVPKTAKSATIGKVELIATSLSGEVRRASSPFTVIGAKPAPPVRFSMSTSTQQCIGPKRRGGHADLALKYRITGAAKLSVALQRRVNGPYRASANCETLLRLKPKPGAPKIVNRTLRTNSASIAKAGTYQYAVSKLIKPSKLGPGRYRLIATAVDAQGNKSVAAVEFFVLGK